LRGQSHPHPYEYVLWGGGLLLAMVVTAALGRLAVKVIAEGKNDEAVPVVRREVLLAAIPSASDK